jgi:hypothetical protein
MPVIFIETEKIGANSFELMQSISVGFTSLENAQIYETDDRLLAAIMNLGFACRYLADGDYSVREVQISSDTDGKVFRYNGEHNKLFSLVFPYNDAQAQKIAGLYAEYNKYLERIRFLIKRCKIKVTLKSLHETTS